MTSSGQQAREWIRLLRAGGLSGLGLDTNGTVLIEVWPEDGESIRGTVPMSGTPEQVQDLMDRIFQGSLETTDTGWIVNPKDPVGEPWEAKLEITEEGKSLVFNQGIPKGPDQRPFKLLEGLESHTGCYLFLEMDKDGNKPPPIDISSLLLALTDDPVTPLLLRVETGYEFPVGQASMGAPIGGTSTEQPKVVLTLGISPYDLSQIRQFREDLAPEELAELDKKLERSQKLIQLPAGATMAFFGSKEDPQPVLVLPVLNARGKPFRPARLNRLLKRYLPEETAYERVARDAFHMTTFNRAKDIHAEKLYGRIVEGRIVLGSQSESVDETAFGIGEPWLRSEDLEWAATWPISARFQTPPVPMLADGLGGLAGLRSNNGMMEFAIQPKQSLGAVAPVVLSGLAAIAIPNFITMQQRAKRAELPTNLKGIYTAMLAAKSSGQPIAELPISPRSVEELDKTQAEWLPSAEWETIGWEPDGRVRGVYWTKILPDGRFEVHAMADLDEDGEPCHFMRTEGEAEEIMVTAPDVY
jgi:hypothetical protein